MCGGEPPNPNGIGKSDKDDKEEDNNDDDKEDDGDKEVDDDDDNDDANNDDDRSCRGSIPPTAAAARSIAGLPQGGGLAGCGNDGRSLSCSCSPSVCGLPWHSLISDILLHVWLCGSQLALPYYLCYEFFLGWSCISSRAWGKSQFHINLGIVFCHHQSRFIHGVKGSGVGQVKSLFSWTCTVDW